MTFPWVRGVRNGFTIIVPKEQKEKPSQSSFELSVLRPGIEGKKSKLGQKSMGRQCFGTEVAALVGKEDCSKKRRWEEKERNV